MADFIEIFNRHSLCHHRDRAAANIDEFDFLFAESAERLADRLDDVKRSFPLTLDLGSHGGVMGRLLKGRGGIETFIESDLSPKMATRSGEYSVAADEEFLPFADGTFDLIISNLSLHWVNDLPGAMIQIRRALKPDGLFLATMFGTETLHELRDSLALAESKIEGGLSPRISPYSDLQTLGGLLQRAGFSLPVTDSDVINVSYPNPFKLMTDLRGMGETNNVNERRTSFTRRATIMSAADFYTQNYTDENDRVPATFQVITLTGWSPDETQPKPLKPGSGQTSLTDVFMPKKDSQ